MVSSGTKYDAHGTHTSKSRTRMSGAPPATPGHFSFAKRSAQNDKRTPAHYGYGTNGLCSFTPLVLPFAFRARLCV
jgi:hypothetical protein